MSLKTELAQYVIKNIWSNPRQDHQFTVAPKRITPNEGVMVKHKVLNRIIKLPDTSSKWHIFQIGQVSPNTFNLIREYPDWRVDVWIPFTDTIHTKNVIMQMYNDKSVVIPSVHSYVMYMDERNVIIAIPELNKLPINFKQDQFYMRVYQNAYFESDRFTGDTSLETTYSKPTTVQQIQDIQLVYLNWKERPGYVTCWVNGVIVNAVDLVNVNVGDHVELLYDSSVRKVVDFKIADLQVYVSELDSTNKYLLSYPADDVSNIDYCDDQELYLLNHNIGRYKGIPIYKHKPEIMRMVTHRDYGLHTGSITNFCKYLQDLTGNPSNEPYIIRMLVREAGYRRSLVFEHNRIHELYKLDYQDVIDALIGTAGSIPVWRATNLENSAYTRLISSPTSNIPYQDIIDGLAYNGLSRILGNTPVKINEGDVYVELPSLLETDSTVYEYDSDGFYLGNYENIYGKYYIPRNSEAVYFEALRGKAGKRPNVYFFNNNLIPLPSNNWRLYKSAVNGQNTFWVDVTDSQDITINQDTINYGGSLTGSMLMLRTDKSFLAYDLNIKPHNGVLKFTLQEEYLLDNEISTYNMFVPAGELEIILNGRSLIDGIDYKVNFPEVTIFNKNYLKQPALDTVQSIHIRFTGLSLDGKHDSPDDVGFIEHGFLSNNYRHDIRDDRVMRIVVNGGIKTREDIIFSETNAGVSIVNSLNGHPYCLADIMVPMKEIVSLDTYKFRDASRLIDKEVSDYMSLELPQPLRNQPSAIVARHALYSPFLSAIINDIISLYIDPSVYTRNMSRQQVMDACLPYERLLRVDPIFYDNLIDSRYVVIHPHPNLDPLSLNVFAYKFITEVVSIYGNGLIRVEDFLKIEGV